MDEFITDAHRITCRNMTKLQNDTTACYDRMISNLTSLVSRSYHVPDNACKIQAHVLKAMKYKVITSLGISEDHYSHSASLPIHGTCQGSGSSGTNWLLNSVPMMNLISQICNGLEIISPDKQITWTKHILGLVDDARQYSNDWKNNQMTNVISKLQHASQTWEHLLATTCGKLEIPKCVVYTL